MLSLVLAIATGGDFTLAILEIITIWCRHLVFSFDQLPGVHRHVGLILRVCGSPIHFIVNYYASIVDYSHLSLISIIYLVHTGTQSFSLYVVIGF